jgi:hypothetical protein
MPPKKSTRSLKTDKDDGIDIEEKLSTIEAEIHKDSPSITDGEKHNEVKQETDKPKEKEIKDSWEENVKEHTDEDEVKDVSPAVYRVTYGRREHSEDRHDERRDDRRERQRSIVDFDYKEYANLTGDISELSTENILKYLIVRSRNEGQNALCNAIKFVLRGKNCEVSFDRITEPPRSFNRSRRGGGRSDIRGGDRRRMFKNSSQIGRTKFDE